MKEMLLSITTAIEAGILVLFILLCFCCHFFFLFLLILVLYIGYLYYKRSKLKMCIEEQNMVGFVYSTQSDKLLEYKTNCRVPRIGDNELFVKVYSASINPVDYKVISKKIPFTRWLSYDHHGVGKDFAGKILHIGDQVTQFKQGDDVFGYSRDGALQEYTRCLETDVVLKPSNISFNQAASLLIGAMTSYQSLNWFFPIEGKKVLIIGGSGGTGHFAVQIAKAQNASQVYAVCSTQKAKYVKQLGADFVICYNEPNYLSDLNGINFDLIYDTVTSAEDGDQEPIYSPYLESDGKYVAINGAKWKFLPGGFNSKVFKCGCLEKKNYHLHLLNWNQKDMEIMGRMASEKKLEPTLEVIAFDEGNVINAYDNLKGRRVKGKIVIEISKPETDY